VVPERKTRTNYIFVDYENVQALDLDRIADKSIQVVLVLGERHKSLPLALVKQLLKYAGQVALVETGRGGKNALDLVLAHHIGVARQSDPHAYFHILSRDKDFDALIEHLRANETLASRHASFSDIPILMNPEERVKYIIDRFSSAGFTRAGALKTLGSQIQALFGKALSPSEVDATIQGLIAEKALQITDRQDVVYPSRL
jgi:hypothetical protein